MKIRSLPSYNYKAIYNNGKTIRFKYYDNLLTYPLPAGQAEFYDIGINNLCNGNCPYCYVKASSKGKNFDNVTEKIKSFFGNMEPRLRPFQVAIGGSGEPTLHPELPEILKTFQELGIEPNITTNGINDKNEEIINAIKKFCRGLAVSTHQHIKWQNSNIIFNSGKLILNLHFIISDINSVKYFIQNYKNYHDFVDYFVLLPLVENKKIYPIDYDYLATILSKNVNIEKIAFGGHFYEFLKMNLQIPASLYIPDTYSQYIIFDDECNIYNNSFDMKKIGVAK